MVLTLRRKIMAAILSSLLFAWIFSMIGGFEGDAFFTLYYLNFILVVTYGVMTSFLSDWLSTKLSKRAYTQEIISFLFHCFFGLILKVLSLVSAISFFMIDRLLRKGKIGFGWPSVIIALCIVGLVFFMLIQ